MNKIFLALVLLAGLGGCKKLDLTDPTGPSTGNFYNNQTELELAVNDLYRLDFWGNDNRFFGDDNIYRANGNAVVSGTMTSEDASVKTYWLNAYKAIARVNSFIAHKDKAAENTPENIITKYEAEMRLIRAYQYAKLVTHFGDVPLLTEPIELGQAYGIKRTGKEAVLDFIFSELDFSAANLPASYAASAVRRLTKGVAFAIKARTALYMQKWDVAKAAADSVIQLANAGVYTLHPDYAQLFLKEGELSKEIIWSIPKDEKQKVFNGPEGWVKEYISRNAGGYGAYFPSWDIMDAYECTDGKPIDESPLYDRKNPFKKRDPRLTASIVEFGTPWLGFSYQPNPDSTKVWSYKSNSLVNNNDCKRVAAFASFTGLLWKKGIDQSWADRLLEDNDAIVFRLAEIYLIYAEAKIELNEVDQSVVDAINRVRARAYGVALNATASYPAVNVEMGAARLRTVVRRERRVELVDEGLRYMDLIRWKLAEKALTKPIVGLPDPKAGVPQDKEKWPFAAVPEIDEDGIADYSGFGADRKIILERKFDPTRQYLWPIPAVETRVNPNIIQNPNY
ncbi:RagB/SusD family nutrient uptake outer membrane protein [Niabella hirudinis]|uniref:RagB/SusD family nutrient uptake outer membrane protein n=1 Tax=Niabella hirudinis TaxID=1285929 RepID=UPI003EC0E85D